MYAIRSYYDHRFGPVVTLGDDLEEEGRLALFEGRIADLVEDQQARPEQRREQPILASYNFV